MQFDMSAAWNSAVELMKRSFKLQLVIAGLFILVPSAIAYLIFPELLITTQTELDGGFNMTMPEGASAMTSIVGFLLTVIQMVGLISILALMARSRPTVGESLGIAMRSLPTLIGATILLAIGFLILLIPIFLIFGVSMSGVEATMGGAGMGGFAIIAAIAFFVLILYLYTRLSMVLPIATLGGERNVKRVITGSWRLTKGSAGRLFGFYALLFIAAIVISIPVGLLVGGAAAIGGGAGAALSASMLLNLVVSAILNIVMMAVLAAVFFQLSGTASPDIAETFE